MPQFKKYTIGDFVESVSITHTFPNEKIIFLNTSDILEGKILHNNYSEVSGLPGQAKKSIKKEDILFSEIRPGNKRYALVEAEANDYVVSTKLMVLRKKSEVVDFLFFYKWLTSEPVLAEFQNIAESRSGTFPQITFDVIKDIEIDGPSEKETQTLIAAILSSLDDKIELNRRTNQTLEQIAQILFKKYFVDDIDPENLPEEWSLKSIYDLAIFINGAAFKNSDFSKTKEALPIIKIVELKYGITNTTMFSNKNLEEKYKIENGDILFSWSGSPETSIDTFLWVNNTAWLNQHIFKVVTDSNEMRTYVYYLLNYFKPIFIDIAKNKQTTGLGHVTINDLKRLKVAFPDSSTLSRFASEVSPTLDCIQNNLLENKNIITIRDSLLPKLMSGEIEVNVTEKELVN